MKFSDDELITIVDDVTTTFSELLLTFRELNLDLCENEYRQNQDASDKARLDNLKKEVEKAKEELAKSRAHRARNKQLQRLKQQQDKASADKTPKNEGKRPSGTTTRFTDSRGRLVGTKVRAGKNRTYFYSADGKVASIEVNGQTFNGAGKFCGRGEIGLLILGLSMRR